MAHLESPGIDEPAPGAPSRHRRRPRAKLPVIRRLGASPPASLQALELASERQLSPNDQEALFADMPRPRTRGECAGGIRPCPFVSCRYHLFLDVHPTSGSIRLNHPGVELEDMAETCVLDVADRVARKDGQGGSLCTVAKVLGVSHERVRQIEAEAKASFAAVRAALVALGGTAQRRVGAR